MISYIKFGKAVSTASNPSKKYEGWQESPRPLGVKREVIRSVVNTQSNVTCQHTDNQTAVQPLFNSERNNTTI